jgi:DNA-binding transcriptional LysR family regulator
MQVFVNVAELGSFAKAARKLGMSAAAVTRSIGTLERHLGVKVLDRTTRYVRPTDAGHRYLEDARRILIDLSEIEEAAASAHASPRGHLTITAPVMLGRMHVLPIVVEYLAHHSTMTVSAHFLDRFVNLWEEGFDVGIRIGELPDSRLRAIRVGEVRRILCASAEYLAAWGTPKVPGDLVRHSIIMASGVTPTPEWRFGKDRDVTTARVSPRLTVTDNDAAAQAAVKGLGITRLPSYQVATQLASGSLMRVLPGYEPPAFPVNVLHREGRHASAKVRSFVDLAVERLRSVKDVM